MALPHIARLDDAVGRGIERLTAAHHARRLRQRGWGHALEPRDDALWFSGDPPPPPGNEIQVLVDVEHALSRLEAELTSAQESVLLAGWTFTPTFRLTRDGPSLRDLLADTAGRADVRVLAWAGAPLPLFHPSRREVRARR